MADAGICFLLILAISIALVIYGFVMLLKKQEAGENDVQVLQRQLRGFGFLLLSQVVFLLGSGACVGLNMSSLKKMMN